MCENVAHCLTNKRREDLLLFSEGLSMLFENLNMVGSSEFRLFCGKNDEPVVALCCAGWQSDNLRKRIRSSVSKQREPLPRLLRAESALLGKFEESVGENFDGSSRGGHNLPVIFDESQGSCLILRESERWGKRMSDWLWLFSLPQFRSSDFGLLLSFEVGESSLGGDACKVKNVNFR